MNFEHLTVDYLDYCKYQKNLNFKTLKAYRIDLAQFCEYIGATDQQPSRGNISNYIVHLNKMYAPKSAKRKIASLKAFFGWMEYEELLAENPFQKIRLKFHEPFLLPRTISAGSLRKIFMEVYKGLEESGRKGAENFSNKEILIQQEATEYATGKNDMAKNQADRHNTQQSVIRDVAVLELLFATGLRVSELCNIRQENLDLEQGIIKIYGKGAKERIIQITNLQVLDALEHYREVFRHTLANNGYFFLNRAGNRLSEQSVRIMINRYVHAAGLPEHITPHMFRHTFATMLLEEDVDIRYIQQILGHSSILTTQIYTHVAANKQKEILTAKHPRNKIVF